MKVGCTQDRLFHPSRPGCDGLDRTHFMSPGECYLIGQQPIRFKHGPNPERERGQLFKLSDTAERQIIFHWPQLSINLEHS